MSELALDNDGPPSGGLGAPAGADQPAAGLPTSGALDTVSDWLNPILVKEVRQSLQGKFFRWMFLITLTTATVIACGQILLADDISDLSGTQFFVPIYAVTMAVGGFWEMLFSVVRRHPVTEGFLVTGALFPLILPAGIPLWQVALGISLPAAPLQQRD